MLKYSASLVILGTLIALESPAWASNPTAGCTEGTFGSPCNHDGTSPCSGVCLLDPSQAGTPIACVPADSAAFETLSIDNLDGAGCSLTGSPGTDCTHSCSGSACTATDVGSGGSCVADGGTNVCSGACAAGACVPTTNRASLRYGREDLAQICIYRSCPAAPPAQPLPEGFTGYPAPDGLPCANDMCFTGSTCGSDGCGGATPIEGCVQSNEDEGADDDAGVATGDDGDAATRENEGGVSDAGTAPMKGGSSCDAGSASLAEGSWAAGALLVFGAAAVARRRQLGAAQRARREESSGRIARW